MKSNDRITHSFLKLKTKGYYLDLQIPPVPEASESSEKNNLPPKYFINNKPPNTNSSISQNDQNTTERLKIH